MKYKLLRPLFTYEILRDRTRRNAGKTESPSVGIIDSQSVKTIGIGGLNRGIDGGKKTKGRKRHIIVDTMGLLLAVVVHAANEHDSKSAPMVIAELRGRFSRLVKIIADGGYRGELIENTRKIYGWIVEIVLRSDSNTKFDVLPKRRNPLIFGLFERIDKVEQIGSGIGRMKNSLKENGLPEPQFKLEGLDQTKGCIGKL